MHVIQNPVSARKSWQLSGGGHGDAAAAGTTSRSPLLRQRHIHRGSTMNRNVTIGLGTLIVIIIIVALVF